MVGEKCSATCQGDTDAPHSRRAPRRALSWREHASARVQFDAWSSLNGEASQYALYVQES